MFAEQIRNTILREECGPCGDCVGIYSSLCEYGYLLSLSDEELVAEYAEEDTEAGQLSDGI